MHIPKTAGTSLNILKFNFESDKIYPFATYHQLFTNSKLNFEPSPYQGSFE